MRLSGTKDILRRSLRHLPLLLVPVLYAIYAAWLDSCAGPDWQMVMQDVAYCYLLNGLSLVEGNPLGVLLTHPGVPLITLDSAVIWGTHAVTAPGQDLTSDVLANPERYTRAIGMTQTVLIAIALLVLGGVARRATRGPLAAMACQAVVFLVPPYHHAYLTFGLPETMYLLWSLLLAVVGVYLLTVPASRGRYGPALAFGLICALAVTTKLTCLPLCLFPLLLLTGAGRRVAFVLSFLAGSLMLMLPVADQWDDILRLWRSVAGDPVRGNLEMMAAHGLGRWWTGVGLLAQGAPALFLFMGASVGYVILLLGHPVFRRAVRRLYAMRLVLASLASQAVLVAWLANRPSSLYLVQTLGLSAAIVLGLWRMTARIRPYSASSRALALATPLVAIGVVTWLVRSILAASEASTRRYSAALAPVVLGPWLWAGIVMAMLVALAVWLLVRRRGAANSTQAERLRVGIIGVLLVLLGLHLLQAPPRMEALEATTRARLRMRANMLDLSHPEGAVMYAVHASSPEWSLSHANQYASHAYTSRIHETFEDNVYIYHQDGYSASDLLGNRLNLAEVAARHAGPLVLQCYKKLPFVLACGYVFPQFAEMQLVDQDGAEALYRLVEVPLVRRPTVVGENGPVGADPSIEASNARPVLEAQGPGEHTVQVSASPEWRRWPVSAYSLAAPGGEEATHMPRSWRVLAEDDTGVWRQIDQREAVAAWRPGQRRRYAIDSDVRAGRYRLVVETPDSGKAVIGKWFLRARTQDLHGLSGRVLLKDVVMREADGRPRRVHPARYWWLERIPQFPLTVSFSPSAVSMPSVTGYSLQADPFEPGRMPSHWALLGGRGDQQWRLLDLRSDQDGWSPRESRLYNMAAPGVYERYRLIIFACSDQPIVRIGSLSLRTFGRGLAPQQQVELPVGQWQTPEQTRTMDPSRLFMGDTAFWETATGFPTALTARVHEAIDLTAPTAYRLTAGPADHDALDRMPMRWRLMVSDDARQWTLVDERSEEGRWAPRESRSFPLTNVPPGRYWRLEVLATRDPTICRLYDMSLLAPPPRPGASASGSGQ